MELRSIILISAIFICTIGLVMGYVRYKENKRQYLLILSILFAGFLLPLLSELAIAFYGVETNNALVIFLTYLIYPSTLLIAPSHYLYVKYFLASKTENDEKNPIIKIKHFIPSITLFVVNIFAFGAFSQINPESSNYVFLNNIIRYLNFATLFILFLLQNIFYLTLSFYKLFADINYFSVEGNRKTFRWLSTFLISFFLIFIFTYLFQINYFQNGKVIFRVTSLIYLIILFFYGFREYTKLDNPADDLLSTAEFLELKTKILRLMEEEKIYLDNSLTLSSLSKKVDSNTKYVSKLINHEFNLNVSTFINQYRIEEAKRVLSDQENHIYTIETIASMTGYNSKSSFNSSFKKITGMTPSQFKKNQLELL